MLATWTFCVIAFFLLPFELVGRSLSWTGFTTLAFFIAAFCFGTLIRSIQSGVSPAQGASGLVAIPDFTRADRIIIPVVALTLFVFAIEFATGNYLDLEAAFQSRSESAAALAGGLASDSSIFFQIGFLLYPLGYVVLVREIIYRDRLSLVRIVLLGGLPILMATLVLGGRGPILIGLALAALAYRTRGRLKKASDARHVQSVSPQTFIYTALFGLGVLAASSYFVRVFLVRAENVGGAEAMFDLVASSWGVTFSGPAADALIATAGYGNTYVIFAFAWYLLQGLVMSNVLFTDYTGDPHFGVYGIDIVTAIMRRVDGEFVADRFATLFELNTYGFLPSAFGALYVDLGYAGLIACVIWGYLCAMVFYRMRTLVDARWCLLGPFISHGIFFSLINTPLGYGNGFMIHFWLLVIFFMTRPASLAQPAPRVIVRAA